MKLFATFFGKCMKQVLVFNVSIVIKSCNWIIIRKYYPFIFLLLVTTSIIHALACNWCTIGKRIRNYKILDKRVELLLFLWLIIEKWYWIIHNIGQRKILCLLHSSLNIWRYLIFHSYMNKTNNKNNFNSQLTFLNNRSLTSIKDIQNQGLDIIKKIVY